MIATPFWQHTPPPQKSLGQSSVCIPWWLLQSPVFEPASPQHAWKHDWPACLVAAVTNAGEGLA